MSAERGFTLIEILVVLIIISITIGFALLAFGDFGASRRAVVSAEQFSSYVKLVQQQAILESNPFGIALRKEGYETYHFVHGSWQPMSTKRIFHWRALPTNVVASLHSTIPRKGPGIVISPVGNMSEFIASFGTSKKPDIIRVLGKPDGQLVLQQPKS